MTSKEQLRAAFDEWCKGWCSPGANSSEWYWTVFQGGAEAQRRLSGETNPERQALAALWDVMDNSEEDAQTGAMTLEAGDWHRMLSVFWELGEPYRGRLSNLGWWPESALKTNPEPT